MQSEKSIDESASHLDVKEIGGIELAGVDRGFESSGSVDISPNPDGLDDMTRQQDSSSNSGLRSERQDSSELVEILGEDEDATFEGRGAGELGSEEADSFEQANAQDLEVVQDVISEVNNSHGQESANTRGKPREEDRPAGCGDTGTNEEDEPESDEEGEELESKDAVYTLSDDEDGWAKYDESAENTEQLTHEEKLQQIEDILLLERSIEEWKNRMASV